MNKFTTKKKIVNDPIYGFISIQKDIILEVIDHPYFQRLRRIKQLGFTDVVYPGALHTRFHHALGCTHLMKQAIEVLRDNGNEITEEEALGVTLAILLHDVGHGPYSHALEYSIVKGLTHEELSVKFIEAMNDDFDGKLELALKIFKGEYHKKFLHQLVSSQLDMDRLDYLKRDSFYTGVSEGVVSNERIIKMLDVRDDQLVIQEKGIYSIEKFLVARRLMYWQVYLHKTVLSGEFLLVRILERANELVAKGISVFGSPALQTFLGKDLSTEDFQDRKILEAFSELDDYDIFGAIKVWCRHEDKVLRTLADMVVNRNLLKVKIQQHPFSEEEIEMYRKRVQEQLEVSEEDCKYFVFQETMVNNAYKAETDRINILYNSGDIVDITKASDNLNIQALTKPVTKYFLCYPGSNHKN